MSIHTLKTLISPKIGFNFDMDGKQFNSGVENIDLPKKVFIFNLGEKYANSGIENDDDQKRWRPTRVNIIMALLNLVFIVYGSCVKSLATHNIGEPVFCS